MTLIKFGAIASLALATSWALVTTEVYAAGAEHPYSAIDRKVDAGNPTGDAEVDKLNNSQLNQNYHGQNRPEITTDHTVKSQTSHE